jgi:hypothetical protein
MATRHNLCINPSLKNNLTGWDDNGAEVPTRQSVTGFPRSFGARYTTNSAGGFIRTATAAVTAGQTYTLSIYIKPTNTGGGTIYAEWLNSGGGVISYTSNSYTATGGVVTRISHTGVAPTDAVNVRIITDGINFSSNTTDFTAVLIEQTGSLQDFFDGDSTNASWDGTNGNSASTLVDVVLGTVSVNLGPLTSSATGVRGVLGTSVINLGTLTTVAAGVRGVTGNAVVGLGALTTRAVGVSGETVVVRGSWYTLLDIAREAQKFAEAERSRPPTACPNDGIPLERGPNGVLHCSFDGWTYQ